MEETRRHGIVTFVGVLFLLAAVGNLMVGIVVLTLEGNVGEQAVDVGDLPAWDKDVWGIILTAIGGVQALVGLGVLIRASWGRFLGITLAATGAFFNLFFYQAEEGWSFTLIVIQIAVIYILAVHGREFASSD